MSVTRGEHGGKFILFACLRLSCLREVIQNVLEQAHFTDDDLSESYAMYDPSVNYDETLTQDYGGYKSSDTCELTDTQDNMAASSEDLTESQQRPTGLTHPSSLTSSVSGTRFNSEDVPLNYDDTDPESDEDDDGVRRSKSSDDKRIFVKQLNYVKGRQVGLLIGPFGTEVTGDVPSPLRFSRLRSAHNSDS